MKAQDNLCFDISGATFYVYFLDFRSWLVVSLPLPKQATK